MQTLPGARCLIMTACLFTVACTEEKIINEASQSSEAAEAILPDAIEISAADEALADTAQTETPAQTQGIPGAPEPVTITPVPNMVDSSNAASSQATTATETITPTGATEQSTDLTAGSTPSDVPTAEPVTTDVETEAIDNTTIAGNEAATDSEESVSLTDDSPLFADPTTPANMVPDTTDDTIDDSALLADPTTPTTVSTDATDTTTENDALLADAATPETVIPESIPDTTEEPAVTGTPGMNVDCQLLLPCRWLSADTQFAVTVTNADNIGDQGRLAIEYSVLTSHDTEVSIAATDPVTDATGVRYNPATLRLGEVMGGQSQGINAGSSIHAAIEFGDATNASSLSSWTIALSDSGLIRQPSFSSIPVGTITSQHADCAFTLPCAWVSPANDVTITLLSVSSFGTSNRLTANFTVETTRDAVVVLDTGSRATGTDGMIYEGRTHSIGVDTSATRITDDLVPGVQLPGTVFFFRTQSMSAALQRLSLIVHEDEPTPRWNPSFLSVPVQ